MVANKCLGSASGLIVLSDAKIADGSDWLPDTTTADKTYWGFWCPDVKGPFDALMKIKNLVGGSSYSDRSGKRNSSVTFRDCYVVKNTGSTNTDEFNLIFSWLKKLTKVGATPAYLWVKNEVDNVWLLIGDTAAIGTTGLRYMLGFPTKFPWALEGGNLYKFDITWQECLQ